MSSFLLIGMLHAAGGSIEVSRAIDYAPYFGCEPPQVLEAITWADPRDVRLEGGTLHLTERGRVCVQMHGPFLSRVLNTVDDAIRSTVSRSVKRTISRQKRVIGRLRVTYGNRINPRYAMEYHKDTSIMPRELRYLKDILPSKVREELIPPIAFPPVPPLYAHFDIKLQHLAALMALHEFQNLTMGEARKEAYRFGLEESEMLVALSQLVYFGYVEVRSPLLVLNSSVWSRTRKHYDRFFRGALSFASRIWLDRQSFDANTSQRDRVRRVVRLMLKKILDTGELPAYVVNAAYTAFQNVANLNLQTQRYSRAKRKT